jgi:hypothetical protein
MSSKGNLKIWRRVIVALLLLGGVGWFLYSKWELNNKNPEELKQSYAQSRIPDERNANVVRENVAIAAKESEPDHKVADTLKITFRAVGLNRVSSEADQELAFNVLNEMKSSALFDASNTGAVGEISPEAPLSEPPVKSEQGEPPGTFTFKIVAKLRRPLTL